MRTLLSISVWCVLFFLCWPLALLALLLWPVIYLLAVPFRLVGISLAAVLALVQAILFLPARVLGSRPVQNQSTTPA